MRDFKKFDIWNDGMDIVVSAYELAAELPYEEKFGLKSQINRAAVSIPLNIAEGCSRSSQVDFKRFLEIALGSAFELETHYLICLRVGFFSQETLDNHSIPLNKLQRQINSLISKIVDDIEIKK